MTLPAAVALCALMFASAGRAQLEYSYGGDDGPDRWPELFPKCGGRRQSPINIQTSNATRGRSPPLWLDWPGYVPWEANLTNDGHTALVQLNPFLPITLRGGILEDEYQFQQLHFHWGRTDANGSEHAVDSRFSAMEMHMVFFKPEYGSPSRAANHSDGFVVVGILLELSPYNNTRLDQIVSAVQRVPNEGDSTPLQAPLALASLWPGDQRSYFSYQGSLTTPPCDEAVRWILFEDPIPVSRRQVADFRRLYATNVRPLQPVGDRRVSLIKYYGPFRKSGARRGKARAGGHH